MDTKQLRKDYLDKQNSFSTLADQVRFILQQEITRRKIKIHSLIHRIKTFDSFVGKIRRIKSSEPFKDIDDLIGLRVVCLFLSDIDKIGDIVRNKFRVVEEDNKIDDSESEIFGYMSLHIKATFSNSPRTGLREVLQMPFEVQIRTIAQDAWASISHYLDYKQERAIPGSLRRDFHALSGLFYVADTHFLMLRNEQRNYFLKIRSKK